jgi:hypothetical protein
MLKKNVNAQILASTVAIIAATSHELAAENAPIDWSSTITEVQTREAGTAEEVSEKRLTYKTQLKEADYHLEYLFGDEGTLVTILYYKSFPPTGNACLLEYQRMHTLYTTELGAAKTTTAKPVIPAQGEVCDAVASGKFTLSSEWSTDNSSNMNVLLSVWKGQPYVGVSLTPLN